MKWKLPPKIKIYEALGSIGENIYGVEKKKVNTLFSLSTLNFFDLFIA